MKSFKTIPRTALRPLDEPGDGWYVIEASGDFSNVVREGEEEREIIQHLTPEVLSRVAAAGVPAEGVPVDRDHFSLSPEHSSEAVGWVRDLAMCGDMLAGRIEWTSIGRPLVEGRVYKHFSTVYPLDEGSLNGSSFEPSRLVGLALTNQPNNSAGQPPIANAVKNCVSGKGAALLINNNNNAHQMNDIDAIKEALGLSPECSVEDVLSAIKGLQGAADEAAASEAETLLNSEGLDDLPEDEKEELKEGLFTNRGLALLAIKAIKNSRLAAKQQPAAANDARRYAGSPGKGKAAGDKSALVARAKQIANSERAAGRKCSFWKGLTMAKRESK